MELVAPFDGTAHAQAQLIGFGTAVEVLGPSEFRDGFAATAREVAALYADPQGGYVT